MSIHLNFRLAFETDATPPARSVNLENVRKQGHESVKGLLTREPRASQLLEEGKGLGAQLGADDADRGLTAGCAQKMFKFVPRDLQGIALALTGHAQASA